MCLIGKSSKMCSVGVPPLTGLGNTGLELFMGSLETSKEWRICTFNSAVWTEVIQADEQCGATDWNSHSLFMWAWTDNSPHISGLSSTDTFLVCFASHRCFLLIPAHTSSRFLHYWPNSTKYPRGVGDQIKNVMNQRLENCPLFWKFQDISEDVCGG